MSDEAGCDQRPSPGRPGALGERLRHPTYSSLIAHRSSLVMADLHHLLTVGQGRQALAATRWPTVPGRVLNAGTEEWWLPCAGATVYRPVARPMPTHG